LKKHSCFDSLNLMGKAIRIVSLNESDELDFDYWLKKSPADFLRRDTIIQLGLAPVRINIITSCAGIEFRSAWKNRIRAKYGDIYVFFISLKDLIKNKRAVGRDRDLLDAKYLDRVKKKVGVSADIETNATDLSAKRMRTKT